MATLGQVIKDYRKKNKMSLRDFAKKLEMSRAYVYCLEKGVHPKTGQEIVPSFETICKAAEAMGEDVLELMQKIGISVDKETAMEKGIIPPPSLSSGTENLKPWDHIPLTTDNLTAAVKEGRLMITPFRVPRIGMFVFTPNVEYGMSVRYTVDGVQGGVYTASHATLGRIRFTIFDIDRIVFADMEKSNELLHKMQAEDILNNEDVRAKRVYHRYGKKKDSD